MRLNDYCSHESCLLVLSLIIRYFASRLMHFTEISTACYAERRTHNSGVLDQKVDEDDINIRLILFRPKRVD
jgi:hypothetical protein